ncbi:hypothetical protein EON63_13175 [archaeon]|nr:MAG: hypothetical protein EON63_13175 [archaeon]
MYFYAMCMGKCVAINWYMYGLYGMCMCYYRQAVRRCTFIVSVLFSLIIIHEIKAKSMHYNP